MQNSQPGMSFNRAALTILQRLSHKTRMKNLLALSLDTTTKGSMKEKMAYYAGQRFISKCKRAPGPALLSLAEPLVSLLSLPPIGREPLFLKPRLRRHRPYPIIPLRVIVSEKCCVICGLMVPDRPGQPHKIRVYRMNDPSRFNKISIFVIKCTVKKRKEKKSTYFLKQRLH